MKIVFSLNIVFLFPECSGLLGHRARSERILTAPQLVVDSVGKNCYRDSLLEFPASIFGYMA